MEGARVGQFKGVVFDLFDTLVDFDATLFPVVKINGKEERTTSRLAYDALYQAEFPMPGFPAFHYHWVDVSREVWGERDKDPEHREVSSSVRFRRFIERLASIPSADLERAVEIAMTVHMEGLIGSTLFDEDRLDILGSIQKAGMAIGLLSNFDNAAAAHRLLKRTGIDSYLDATLISEEEGYRKPAPRLFQSAAERLELAAEEVLFVGDTFEADVKGPQGVGMPCAWLNRRGERVPDGASPPDYEINQLEGVLGILSLETE
jgi:putative hydrolase of the HAD superfamily